MGYHAETERQIELTGRGKKKIDVYIRDDRASVNQIMLVECKCWASSVPQDVVHSMQAVMHNSTWRKKVACASRSQSFDKLD